MKNEDYASELLEALESIIELAWRDHKSVQELVVLRKADVVIKKAKEAKK